MRNLFLAALGVFAVAGLASAQQPQPISIPVPMPAASPAAAASAPTLVQPVGGTTYIRGNGCNSCGTPVANGCQTGDACNNGCGSHKSNLAFHFGSCKGFFSPCGPTFGYPWSKDRCPTLPLATPYGIGWGCPKQYDSYLNH